MINGGFGLVLDGSAEAERRARQMLSWDVSNGVSRSHLLQWARAITVGFILQLCTGITLGCFQWGYKGIKWDISMW